MLFLIVSHLYALQYDNTLFPFTLFSCLQIVLYFLHSTSVLSFCINVVLTLSVGMSSAHFLKDYCADGQCYVSSKRDQSTYLTQTYEL